MFEALRIKGEKTDLTLNRTCQGQFLSLPIKTPSIPLRFSRISNMGTIVNHVYWATTFCTLWDIFPGKCNMFLALCTEGMSRNFPVNRNQFPPRTGFCMFRIPLICPQSTISDTRTSAKRLP